MFCEKRMHSTKKQTVIPFHLSMFLTYAKTLNIRYFMNKIKNIYFLNILNLNSTTQKKLHKNESIRINYSTLMF